MGTRGGGEGFDDDNTERAARKHTRNDERRRNEDSSKGKQKAAFPRRIYKPISTEERETRHEVQERRWLSERGEEKERQRQIGG